MTAPASQPLPLRAFQWDLARQVERLDFLQRQLRRYAQWGCQEFYLHLENAVHYASACPASAATMPIRTSSWANSHDGRLRSTSPPSPVMGR